MILDAQNQFSSAQALTATADSTNVIDLGVAREIGVGEPMCVLINLGVAADDADGNETYVVELETDDNAAMSSSVILGSATITRGDAAGSRYVIQVPPLSSAGVERYLQVVYTLGGTSPSVTVDAHLIPQSHLQNDDYYADNITIS